MQEAGPHRLTRHDLVATLHRFLASLIPLNTTAILVIDEAQHLDPWVLEQLRLLSNCESDRAKLLQIILVGTPALEGVCRSDNMHHLDQRIARRCHLTPLNREEVVEYIESRLTVASLPADEFTTPAANAIATASDYRVRLDGHQRPGSASGDDCGAGRSDSRETGCPPRDPGHPAES